MTEITKTCELCFTHSCLFSLRLVASATMPLSRTVSFDTVYPRPLKDETVVNDLPRPVLELKTHAGLLETCFPILKIERPALSDPVTLPSFTRRVMWAVDLLPPSRRPSGHSYPRTCLTAYFLRKEMYI